MKFTPPPPPKRPSKITIPEKANPLAKLVFAEMAKQGVTYAELEWRAGVLVSTFKAWRTDNSPGLASIEAALGALGWALVPVPKLERLSDVARAKIEEFAEHFISDEQAVGAAIAAAAELSTYVNAGRPGYHKVARNSLPAQKLALANT